MIVLKRHKSFIAALDLRFARLICLGRWTILWVEEDGLTQEDQQLTCRDGARMALLVTSSAKTTEWLNILRSSIKRKLPALEYDESTYWASFRSPDTNRNVAYLQPYKHQIRLFTRLPLSFDSELQPTPASRRWAEMYPSVFKIRSERAIEKATFLIISSYHLDRRA